MPEGTSDSLYAEQKQITELLPFWTIWLMLFMLSHAGFIGPLVEPFVRVFVGLKHLVVIPTLPERASVTVSVGLRFNPYLKKARACEVHAALDIGCGYPNSEEPYHLRGQIGIDLIRGYADILADAQRLPFKDESFSSTSSHTVLDHIPSPTHALSEVYRVTERGGYTIISLANTDFWGYSFSKPPREHLYTWNVTTLSNLLREVGFKPTEYDYEHVGTRGFLHRVYYLVMLVFWGRTHLKPMFHNVMIVKAVKPA